MRNSILLVARLYAPFSRGEVPYDLAATTLVPLTLIHLSYACFPQPTVLAGSLICFDFPHQAHCRAGWGACM